MFSRIRYAARVLSFSPPKPSKFDEPDLVFEEESQYEPSKLSKGIGNLIEIFVVSVAVGTVAGAVASPLSRVLFPSKQYTSLLTIAGIAAGFLSIIGYNLIEKVKVTISMKLKLGTTIAPYFGHKITKAVQTLRG